MQRVWDYGATNDIFYKINVKENPSEWLLIWLKKTQMTNVTTRTFVNSIWKAEILVHWNSKKIHHGFKNYMTGTLVGIEDDMLWDVSAKEKS